MNKELFWDCGDEIAESLRGIISNEVKSAYEHVFETGNMSIFPDEDCGATFDFTDENHEFRKEFKVDEITICCDPGEAGDEDRKSIISSLERLIERVKATSKLDLVREKNG